MAQYFQGPTTYTSPADMPSNAGAFSSLLSGLVSRKNQQSQNRTSMINQAMNTAGGVAGKYLAYNMGGGNGAGDAALIDAINNLEKDEFGNPVSVTGPDGKSYFKTVDGKLTSLGQIQDETNASGYGVRATGLANLRAPQLNENAKLNISNTVAQNTDDPNVQKANKQFLVNAGVIPPEQVETTEPTATPVYQNGKLLTNETTAPKPVMPPSESIVPNEAQANEALRNPSTPTVSQETPQNFSLGLQADQNGDNIDLWQSDQLDRQKKRLDISNAERTKGTIDGAFDRQALTPQGAKVKFGDEGVSNIPLGQKEESLIKTGQGLAQNDTANYFNHQMSTRALSRQFQDNLLPSVNNLQYYVEKYGDLTPVYTALQKTNVLNGGKYVAGMLGPVANNIPPQDLQKIVLDIQGMESARTQMARTIGGDVGNLAWQEQTQWDFLTSPTRFLDPQSLPLFKEKMLSTAATNLYDAGIVYNLKDVAEFSYDVKNYLPNLKQKQSVNPYSTQVTTSPTTRPPQQSTAADWPYKNGGYQPAVPTGAGGDVDALRRLKQLGAF